LPLPKPHLRDHCLEVRASISLSDAQVASQAIIAHVQNVIGEKQKRIAAYMPVRGELDVMPLCNVLHDEGHEMCLPVIGAKDQPLTFRHWTKNAPLIAGTHGIKIPEGSGEIVPEILLVPLVAFDTHGHRLGYGAGYYDRTLAALRKENAQLLAVGIGYARQQVEHVPADPWDQTLDAVVTEQGLTRFR